MQYSSTWDTSARLHEFEEIMAANSNGVVPDQPNPDDDPNLKDVPSDEEDDDVLTWESE